MTRKYRRRPTKQMIIQMGTHLYLTEGFTTTTNNKICKALDISAGQFTFHFPTKEHLLLELIKELCSFQWEEINRVVAQGDSGLYAYALEIASQTAICEKNENARDFYSAAFTHPMSVALIKDYDYKKAQQIFGKYNPDWTEKDFICVENIAAGIEWATIVTPCNENTSLEDKIKTALESSFKIYNVPKSETQPVIDSILAMDYGKFGNNLLEEFKNKIDEAGNQLVEEWHETHEEIL